MSTRVEAQRTGSGWIPSVLRVVAATSAAAVAAVAIGAIWVGRDAEAIPWNLVLMAVVWAIPGALLATGNARSPLGWLMLAFALVLAGAGFAATWLVAGHPAGAAWAAWLVGRGSAVLVPLGLVILLLLPDGRLPSPSWRPIAGVAVGIQTIVVVVWSLSAGTAAGPDSDLPEGAANLPNPVGILPAAWGAALAGLDFWLLQLPLLLGVVAVVQRLRRPDERQRLAAVLAAAGAFALMSVIGRALWPAAAGILDVVGSALLAAALCSAVLRRRLHDVEVVVSHAVVYVVLTTGIAALYVATVAALGALGWSLPPFGAGVVTAAIALALLPLRTRLQRLVDRLMFGDTRAIGGAVRRLASAVASSSSLVDVADGLARTTAVSLRAPWVAVSVVGGPTVEHGTRHRSATERSAELVAAGREIGQLAVAFPSGRRPGDRDVEALRELADHGARAIRAVQLAEELRESRRLLVTAREEERARLRRDLHDELGPTLASLTMQLAGLEEVIREDPDTAAARVPVLTETARDALDHVRLVARGLRPPTLDELGLTGALGQLAASLGVELTVDEASTARLPAGVEVAALRIGAEAITNVSRHSGSRAARLTLQMDGADLVMRIADQGRGIGDAPSGVGMLSMRERTEELDGDLRIVPTPGGGTTVEARLPALVGTAAREAGARS